MSYFYFPLFCVERPVIDKVEAIVLTAASQPFTPATTQERALELVMALQEECQAARYHRDWHSSRLNMSRSQWAVYGRECNALSDRAQARAEALYEECRALVATLLQ